MPPRLKLQSTGGSSLIRTFFSTPHPLILTSLLLRAIFLIYGLAQDAFSPVKYTDIDYLVFTDAARSVSLGSSPYERETYRYTPLLSWLLVPTTFFSSPSSYFLLRTLFFSSGKILFALADIVAGYFLLKILALQGLEPSRARKFAALWLLNPMVVTISTRGSSEGLLGVLTAALLWATMERKVTLAGGLLGLGVHFKIYPFIYAPAILWWMDSERMASPVWWDRVGKKGKKTKGGKVASPKPTTVMGKIVGFVTMERITLTLTSLAVFMGLNLMMYLIYGQPFLTHTYLHHITRIDHRHNFSPYNTLLYLVSASPPSDGIHLESLAFLPQILLSTVLIPLACAKRDLSTTMLAQTFAFVTFNKVCTSQYFLWYLIFLPLYLPTTSSLLHQPLKGTTALALWVATQAAWLHQAYRLEFLGTSTFIPGLWWTSITFFLVNCWILGVVVGDVGSSRQRLE